MYQTINIFPTTIYVGELENHLHYKKKFYDVDSEFNYRNSQWDVTSENTFDSFIHLNQSLDSLFSEIVLHIKKYIFDVLEYKDIFNVVITKTWLSRARQAEDQIKWHNHSTSHISFSYYIDTPPNSHCIKFLNPHNFNSLFAGNNTSTIKSSIENYNEFNSSTFHINPKQGSIILFPSSLRHRTEKVSDSFKGERLAIIGDVILVLKENNLGYSQGYVNPKYWKLYS